MALNIYNRSNCVLRPALQEITGCWKDRTVTNIHAKTYWLGKAVSTSYTKFNIQYKIEDNGKLKDFINIKASSGAQGNTFQYELLENDIKMAFDIKFSHKCGDVIKYNDIVHEGQQCTIDLYIEDNQYFCGIFLEKTNEIESSIGVNDLCGYWHYACKTIKIQLRF